MYHKIIIPLVVLFIWAACQNTPTQSSVQNDAASAISNRPKAPEWARYGILYECNVRQFSPEGNFEGVRKALPRLQELGTDILWLMPIHPIGKLRRKGGLGSPYSVQDYYGINPDYGNLEDLKALIGAAHGLGLRVILDWVPNHTAWDAVWMKTHPEYYTRINGAFTTALNEHGQPTDWDDTADLDYNQPALRKAMIEAMQYWVRTCDIDGFRVDMAGLVPNDFWAEVRPALDSIKPLFMLSEWQDEPGHFNTCFNTNYGWKWKDVTKDIAQGKQNAQSLDTLHSFLNNFYPEGYAQVYFTQNHDENTWTGTESELYGPAADAFNVLMFTWQGMPMLYNGQEDGMNQRLAFFEKDPIKWKDYGKTRFFQNLCSLRHHNKALQTGKNGGPLVKIPTNADESIYAFTRAYEGDRVVVILNLSKDHKNVTLHPADEMVGAYINVFDPSTVQVTRNMNLNLEPWAYLVLTNK